MYGHVKCLGEYAVTVERMEILRLTVPIERDHFRRLSPDALCASVHSDTVLSFPTCRPVIQRRAGRERNRAKKSGEETGGGCRRVPQRLWPLVWSGAWFTLSANFLRSCVRSASAAPGHTACAGVASVLRIPGAMLCTFAMRSRRHFRLPCRSRTCNRREMRPRHACSRYVKERVFRNRLRMNFPD